MAAAGTESNAESSWVVHSGGAAEGRDISMQCTIVTHDTFWGLVHMLGHDGRKCFDDDAMMRIHASPEYVRMVRCVASHKSVLMTQDSVCLSPAYFAASYAAPCDEAPHYLLFTCVSDMFQRIMDMYDDAFSLGHESPGGDQEHRRHMLAAAITNMELVIDVVAVTEALSAMC